MKSLPYPESASLSPTLRRLRLVLRVVLITFGLYAILRGIHIGKRIAAEDAAYFAAERAALDARLDAESKARFDKRAEDRAEIYRGLNTIFSFAGLPSIGDGE